MNAQYWDKPVDLEMDRNARYRTITATHYAREVLMTLWPINHGPAYKAALRACVGALNGRASVAEAREAFVAAAVEARILVSAH